MKKNLKTEGVNGVFTGSVDVCFNYRSEPINSQNPCDAINKKYFHIIKGTAEELTFVSEEFTNPRDAVHFAEKMEVCVMSYLKRMSERVRAKEFTVEQELSNLGYSS